MPYFRKACLISDITDEEKKFLQEKFPSRFTLGGIWSWNGEFIPVESEEQLTRLGEDEEYAIDILIKTNTRM